MTVDDLIDGYRQFFLWFDSLVLFYVMALNVFYLVFVFSGWRTVHRYVALRPMRDYGYVGRSPLSMAVSILVPAYNEEKTIVPAIQALLRTQFNELEVVIVNDGSTDGTLGVLEEVFTLVPIDRSPRSGLATKPVRGVHASVTERRIIVIDKENGGKADSLNVALNYSQYPLVCAIDADTIMDPGALARLVWEFQSDPDIVATGGIVRIINGSSVKGGQITQVRTPRDILGNIQIVEYLRAFLGGRLAWSRWNMLLIISGAFGLFRRDVIVSAGGYDADNVGEDAELVVRIRRQRAEQGLPCRITFFPDPICWTEAPSDMAALSRQRDRWQRGLGELLIKHRRMTFNPRYGRIGMLAVPFYWIFEFLEPVITVTGVTLVAIGFVVGLVDPFTFALILSLITFYGFFISLGVIMMEERAFRRYPNWSDLIRMGMAIFAENFGYRQYLAYVRFRAMFRIRTSKSEWGENVRSGFHDEEFAYNEESRDPASIDPAVRG